MFKILLLVVAVLAVSEELCVAVPPVGASCIWGELLNFSEHGLQMLFRIYQDTGHILPYFYRNYDV